MIGILEPLMGLLKKSGASSLTIGVLMVHKKKPTTVQAMADDAIEFETRGLVLLIIYPDAGHGSIFQYHSDFVGKVIQFLE
ncbi:hypothetical protein [Acinetobacter calcoaceticus]|uniref:hypothetical protein n=1 Tax=Acinetobacter calcoaceticus TaxID=471 RepID=UPI0018DCAE6C|nr:hypothetical protein [Acinetobacter calcoaceticus]